MYVRSQGDTHTALDQPFDPNAAEWREPSQFRMTVTAGAAALMLDSNTHNRPISWRKVNDYAREMKKGNWRYNPADALCFDVNGVLQNGQHRLLAVLDCEQAQDFAVATGVDPDVQDVMDSGIKRSTAHQLALSGYNEAKGLAATARIYLTWVNGTVTSSLRTPSTPDTRKWVQESDPEALNFAISQGKRVAGLFPLRAGIAGAAAFSAFVRDRHAAQEFFDALCDGVGLDKGHPVLTLRNYLTRQAQLKTRFTQHHQLWLLVSTWNSWRQGRTLGKIMSPSEWSAENFPRMK